MTRTVVLGVRVSTDDKNQDPTNQLLPLRAAMARLGWVVAAEVVIEGLSGWDAKQAAEVKRRFLEPVLAGKADTLAVWCLDRVVRGGIEPTLAFVRELEQHHGAHLYSLQEPWASSATQDKATRELVMSLMAWIAQQESSRKSERVKAKVVTKRDRAGQIGQKAKWGRGSLPTAADRLRVWELRDCNDGHFGGPTSARQIAEATGIPKSTVNRILNQARPATSVPREPLGQAVAATDGQAPSEGGPLGQASDGAGAAGGPA